MARWAGFSLLPPCWRARRPRPSSHRPRPRMPRRRRCPASAILDYLNSTIRTARGSRPRRFTARSTAPPATSSGALRSAPPPTSPITPSSEKRQYALAVVAERSQHLDHRQRLAQKVFGGWEVVGAVEAGFNPYSFRLINGPQSQANNNQSKTAYQTTMFDSAAPASWTTGRAFSASAIRPTAH